MFLDEINSLPLSVQGKLLRTLEEKSIQRIGSTRIKKVDFRLVAATNRNLSEMVQAKTFREDLYYRIQVIPLTIPPMRNRREDIIPLCLHFLHYFCQKYNIQKSFSDIVLKEVQEYDWPGNVREIRNFVERMVVMTPRAAREINVIPPGMLSSVPKPDSAASCDLPSPHCSRRGPSRDQILRALSECSGHREKAAEYLAAPSSIKLKSTIFPPGAVTRRLIKLQPYSRSNTDRKIQHHPQYNLYDKDEE